MTSTNVRNAYGNYELETAQRQKYANYLLQEDVICTHYAHAGNGLLPPNKVMNQSLSYNHTDIESFLRGTSATNFIQPFQIQPLLKTVPNLNIYDRPPTSQTLLPDPLFIQPNQRPAIP